MAEWELKANAGVIVPKARIPKVIREDALLMYNIPLF
jgi:hypothetical protein